MCCQVLMVDEWIWGAGGTVGAKPKYLEKCLSQWISVLLQHISPGSTAGQPHGTNFSKKFGIQYFIKICLVTAMLLHVNRWTGRQEKATQYCTITGVGRSGYVWVCLITAYADTVLYTYWCWKERLGMSVSHNSICRHSTVHLLVLEGAARYKRVS